MRLYVTIAAAALAASTGPFADAHHSFAAEFSYEATGTIAGEVIEVLFVNPHARYFLTVQDENGEQVIWDAQTRSPNALVHVGWSKDTIRVGDRVTLEGNLSRDGSRKIWVREVRMEGGRVIRPTDEAEE